MRHLAICFIMKPFKSTIENWFKLRWRTYLQNLNKTILCVLILSAIEYMPNDEENSYLFYCISYSILLQAAKSKGWIFYILLEISSFRHSVHNNICILQNNKNINYCSSLFFESSPELLLTYICLPVVS